MFAASKTSAAAAGAPPGPSTDPEFNYVTMLLHGDGTNGAQNNTFVSEPVVVPSGVGYLAGQFKGTTDYLTVGGGMPSGQGTEFTLEFWAYSTTVGVNVFTEGPGANTLDFYVEATGTVKLDNTGVVNIFTTSAGVFPFNTWVHVALTRTTGNLYTLYINGVSVASGTNSTSYTANTTIGWQRSNTSFYFKGYLSNWRVTNTLIYTSNFSVPTSPLTAISGTSLLTCQSGTGSTFADNSTNNFAITVTGTPTMTGVATTPPGAVPYAGSFNGSSQYLTVADNAAFNFGTGDFTIEAWFYATSSANSPGIFAKWGYFNDNWLIRLETNNTIRFYYLGGSISTTQVVSLNTWNHVAVTRSSNSVRIFVNGVQTGSTTTVTANLTNTTPVSVGTYLGSSGNTSSNPFAGYISNVRAIKGTAVYTSNFAPPASPLTAITNTSLLTCQNATFIDNSPNNFTITNNGSTPVVSSYILPTITRNGTPTQGSFSPYGDLWSNFFNSANISAAYNAALDVSSGDFTIEFWVNAPAQTGGSNSVRALAFFNGAPATASDISWNIVFNTTGSITFQVCSGGSVPISIDTAATACNNSWNHVAVTRNGSTYRIFLNGIVQATGTFAGSGNTSAGWRVYVGSVAALNTTNIVSSYISNVRIVKGTAIYTSNFTPSTTPLTAVSGTSLLTCQSNRFRDNSSNNFAITVTGTPSVQRFSPFDPAAEYSTSVIGGSGYFNGTVGNYASAPDSAAFQFGSGDFTIEGWMYLNSLTASSYFLGKGDRASVAGSAFSLPLTGYTMDFYAGSSVFSLSTFTPTLNAWFHIAIVRNGTTITRYINGVSNASVTIGTASINTGGTNEVRIGGYVNSTGFLGINGYLSNLRIVKGTAVYTAAFTPPTVPLTAITNTSLLLNTVNAGIFDNAMMNDLVTVGNAQVSTAVKKYGTGSMAFDGSGDYLSAPSSVNLAFGTGDFTIECWAYFNGVSTQQNFIDMRNASVGTAPILYVTATGNINYSAGGAALISGTSALTATTWAHIALVRSGGSSKIYVNGTQVGSTATDSNNFAATSATIGGVYNGTNLMTGYIDDLRITKGIARYTANFTPPTAAFPNN